MTIRRLAGIGLVLGLFAAPAAAQRPPAAAQKPAAAAKRPPGRGFIAINAGIQAAPSDFTDNFTFVANAEEGTIEARYPATTPLLLDAAAGYRFWGRIGIALGASRTSSEGKVAVRASVPHPLMLDRDREVEGESPDVTRTETAAHLQLFYEVAPKGRWRARFFAGPSYVRVEQELVREVTVNETYPYDTATFRSALTGSADGSGVGFTGGADVSWLLSKRVGAGLLLRYARAAVDLNAPESRNVSTDGGGLQVGAGLRVLF